jgi:hypothetical protein
VEGGRPEPPRDTLTVVLVVDDGVVVVPVF